MLRLCKQIIAMFVSLNFAWPTQLHDLYSVMSVFNLNIQIAAPECSLAWSFASKWVVVAIMPGLALVILRCSCR